MAASLAALARPCSGAASKRSCRKCRRAPGAFGLFFWRGMAVSVQPFHLLGKRKPIVRTLSGRCCVRLGARSSSVHVPPSIPIYFLIAACTILSVNPTGLCTLQLQSLGSCADPGRTAPCGHRANLGSRQRETDLAESEKRKPFPSQSVGLPPRAGARGGRWLPSHSTRPGLPPSSAVRLAMRGQCCSVPPFE